MQTGTNHGLSTTQKTHCVNDINKWNIKINFAYSFPHPPTVPIHPPLSQPYIMTEKKRRRRCMFRGVGRFPSPAPSSSLGGTKKCFIYDRTHTRDAMHKKVGPSGHIYTHTHTHRHTYIQKGNQNITSPGRPAHPRTEKCHTKGHRIGMRD